MKRNSVKLMLILLLVSCAGTAVPAQADGEVVYTVPVPSYMPDKGTPFVLYGADPKTVGVTNPGGTVTFYSDEALPYSMPSVLSNGQNLITEIDEGPGYYVWHFWYNANQATMTITRTEFHP